MSDLKFAFRQLLKNPGFTAVGVVDAREIGVRRACGAKVREVLTLILNKRMKRVGIGTMQTKKSPDDPFQADDLSEVLIAAYQGQVVLLGKCRYPEIIV